MVKRNELILFSILALLIIVGLGGCKKEDNKITLRWSGAAYPGYDKFRSEQSALFEKNHPKVNVKYEPVSGNYTGKILTQFAGNTAPDLIFVPPFIYQEFLKKGVLVDLTDWIARDKEYFAKFLPAVMANGEYKGRRYGIVSNNSLPVLFYNKDIFDAMKIPYPTNDMTLEEMVKLAERTTVRESNGSLKHYGLMSSTTWYQLGMLYGGQVWSNDGKKCNINSEPFRKGIKFLRDIYAVYKVSPPPRETKEMGLMDQFLVGRGAMYMGSSSELATIKIRNRGSRKFNYGVVMLPVPKGGTRTYVCGGMILGISTRSKHPELAYELAKFMCAPERIRFLMQVGDSVPVRCEGIEMQALMSDPDIPRDAAMAISSAMRYTVPLRSVYSNLVPTDQFYAIVGQELERYTILNQDLDKTLKSAENKIQALVK